MRGLNDAADVNNPETAAIADTVAAPLGRPAPSPAEIANTVAGPGAESIAHRENATAIGRFLLLRKIGEGGMGEVYSGYDEQLDRKVAIKVLHAAYAPEETQKRTLREAQALARLSHPNVVAVHEVGQVDGDVFVVMEHIDGLTLRDWQDEPTRTVDEILHAYILAGQGLAAVHAAGMVHRDFKPHNAMIDRQGRVRILDFGLAHARGSTIATPDELNAVSNTLSSQLTAEGAIAGTPAYMSPEQLMGSPLDARTDQFSFCVALYEALYKKLPASANTTSANAIPALASSLAAPPPRSNIPGRISDAIMRGLSRDPETRFPTMGTLLESLDITPHANPLGQSRQRLLFALLLLTTMGAWMVAPAEWFNSSDLHRTTLLLAATVTFVVAVGIYIFRDTLLRNPFHRLRIVFLLIMGLAIAGSRTAGIVHHEAMESVIVRDMFIASTGIAIGTLVFVPRVAASWVTLAIAIAGVITIIFFPQYLGEAATLTMNTAILGYLLAWHRSAKRAAALSSAKVDLAASTLRDRPVLANN
jgi:serine/threonine-protein kinase